MIAWLLATLHLIALGIGLGAIWWRARRLRAVADPPALRDVFVADAWWGIAAALWIVTGLLRAFAGFEKGSAYYLHNPFFHAKMTALVLILLLEIRPMITLMRWRIALRRLAAPKLDSAPLLARISAAQLVLVLLMVVAATAMARGLSL